MKTLFPFILLALFSCGQDKQTQARLDKIDERLVTLENAQTNNNTRMDQLEQQVDTVASGLIFIGNMAMKHDSIVADKQWKRDRSARRGEFWGGLLKTIVK